MTDRPGDGPRPDEPTQPWQQQPVYGGYGGPTPPGQASYGPVPDHPQATTALVLGILGIVLCQVIAPFAWSTGKKAVDQIDASGGRLGGRGMAQAGYVMGVIGTVLLGLYLLFLVAVVGFGAMGAVFSSS
jgi:hypothetical protein